MAISRHNVWVSSPGTGAATRLNQGIPGWERGIGSPLFSATPTGFPGAADDSHMAEFCSVATESADTPISLNGHTSGD